MLTGFHGFHVTMGTIMLFVILMRAMAGHFKPDNHFGFEAVAWYWHFVDVVWLGLFIFVYWYITTDRRGQGDRRRCSGSALFLSPGMECMPRARRKTAPAFSRTSAIHWRSLGRAERRLAMKRRGGLAQALWRYNSKIESRHQQAEQRDGQRDARAVRARPRAYRLPRSLYRNTTRTGGCQRSRAA